MQLRVGQAGRRQEGRHDGRHRRRYRRRRFRRRCKQVGDAERRRVVVGWRTIGHGTNCRGTDHVDDGVDASRTFLLGAKFKQISKSDFFNKLSPISESLHVPGHIHLEPL